MTRAERIEAAAHAVCQWARERPQTPLALMLDLYSALALPPDPVPRRLTEEDVLAVTKEQKVMGVIKGEMNWSPEKDHYEMDFCIGIDPRFADFLNARIFGGDA